MKRSTFELGLTKKKSLGRRLHCSHVFLTWSAAMQIGRKESFYLRKKFSCHRIGLAHQYSRRFTVLAHQHGGRDVMRKQSNCSNF